MLTGLLASVWSVGFLIVVNLMLLVAGNFMEPSSIIPNLGADSLPRGCSFRD